MNEETERAEERGILKEKVRQLEDSVRDLHTWREVVNSWMNKMFGAMFVASGLMAALMRYAPKLLGFE